MFKYERKKWQFILWLYQKDGALAKILATCAKTMEYTEVFNYSYFDGARQTWNNLFHKLKVVLNLIAIAVIYHKTCAIYVQGV